MVNIQMMQLSSEEARVNLELTPAEHSSAVHMVLDLETRKMEA